MAQLYDSDKVRRAAGAVKQMSDPLGQGIAKACKGANDGVAQLEGNAARALSDRLTTVHHDIKSICDNLDVLSASLARYASELEEVDEMLRSEM